MWHCLLEDRIFASLALQLLDLCLAQRCTAQVAGHAQASHAFFTLLKRLDEVQ